MKSLQKMNYENLLRFGKVAIELGKEYTPQLLNVASIGLSGYAVGKSLRDAPKTNEALENAKIKKGEEAGVNKPLELTKLEKLAVTAKSNKAVILAEGCSIVASIASGYAAYANAVTLTATIAGLTQKDKIEAEVKKQAKKAGIIENNEEKLNVINADGQRKREEAKLDEILHIYEPVLGRVLHMSEAQFKDAIVEANGILQNYDAINLSEVYSCFALYDKCQSDILCTAGKDYGWNISDLREKYNYKRINAELKLLRTEEGVPYKYYTIQWWVDPEVNY